MIWSNRIAPFMVSFVFSESRVQIQLLMFAKHSFVLVILQPLHYMFDIRIAQSWHDTS